MWILGLEAGAALFLLLFIVWWTMFAGRKPEQPVQRQRNTRQPEQHPAPGDNETPNA